MKTLRLLLAGALALICWPAFAENPSDSFVACSICKVGLSVAASSHASGTSEGGLITFPAGGFGLIDFVGLASRGGSTNQVYVYLYEKQPTAPCNDNSAYSESAVDTPYRIAPPIALTLGGAPGSWDAATTASAQNLVLSYSNKDTAPSKTIYACLVTAASVTPASTADLSFTIGVVQ